VEIISVAIELASEQPKFLDKSSKLKEIRSSSINITRAKLLGLPS
jgi:hypothetical protein